ncbi:MAG: ABC-type transport auxiliary lipoprotein family protein [Rhodosalinus sp.]|uniref:ABC-type transport auxiliary lipoprotein family protein n=1 Tax=Rhodosalinus sp. TaxID=2047741 RepID=UPI003978875E
MIRAPALCLVALTLSGCTAISAIERASEPLDVHELRAPAELPAARGMQDIQLVVEVPAAGGAIATDRILIRTGATQLAYLPEARWSEDAPVMMQTALVEAFLRTDAFRFVGRRPLGASGDVALVSELVDFGARETTEAGGAVVEMTLVARLVREDDARIVASRRFTGASRVPDTSTRALLAGFDQVSDAVLLDVVEWVLRARGISATAS